MAQARYIMVGGFLGAGKTTAILQIAERLKVEGRRVGLITNDQSIGLVDTAMLGAHDFPVEEITGGCFCCKFNSLLEASQNLTRDAQPDVFIAEPVGSCTDLKATVSYPLRRMYGDDYSIAPLSVLVDPIRAMRILGLEKGKNFSEKVIYIYLKQLEEAEIIVVNKCDLLTEAQLDALTAALKSRFPGKQIQHVSARQGTNLDGWMQSIASGELARGQSMDVDYDIYAEGEALLGWMNATATLQADEAFDGNAFLKQLAGELLKRLQAESAEVAHLKMTLTPEEGNDLAVLNLVRNDVQPELSHTLAEPLQAGELIVNLRAEVAPQFLRDATVQALETVAKTAKLSAEVDHLEAFRPGRPKPTHRLAQS
jgi:G3E family GTPase